MTSLAVYLLSKQGRGGQCSHPASPHCCFADDARLPGILGWEGEAKTDDGGRRPETQTILPLPARDIRGPNPKAIRMGMECLREPAKQQKGYQNNWFEIGHQEDNWGGRGAKDLGKKEKVRRLFSCPKPQIWLFFLSCVTAWL